MNEYLFGKFVDEYNINKIELDNENAYQLKDIINNEKIYIVHKYY